MAPRRLPSTTSAPAGSANGHPGPPARPLAPKVAYGFAAAGIGLALVHTLRLAGDASALALSALTLGAMGALVVGIRRNRPHPAGPWWILVGSALLFTIGAILREQSGSTGDLSAQRALIPDAFTFPGYLLFSVALLWLLDIRRREQRQPGIALDALILATASLVLVWAMLLSPTFHTRGADPVAIVAVSIYPPISVFLVAIAARLAFEPGPRNVAHRMLLAGMVMLLAGDLTYFLVDTGIVDLPGRLVDLPYGFTYSLIAGATLHPAVRTVFQPARHVQQPIGVRERVGLVALALFMPALLMIAWSPRNTTERIMVPGLALALAAMAVVRTVIAMREQARSETRLAHQATHDPLTGLPNRVFALDHLATLLGPAGPGAAIVFADLDRFKVVNESLGHESGDRLLRAVAHRLSAACRPEDVVARVSGDEYCIISPGMGAAEAAALAERVRGSFQWPLDIGTEVHLTASIGYASAPAGPHRNPAALLRDADTAMYRSKDRGGNVVNAFDASMHQRVARRHWLEAELRRALSSDEMTVHYQPIVDLRRADHPLEGFEALARWPHPEGGIAPSDFVPVAEESGLIGDLGRWVLRTACRDLAALRQTPGHRNLTMSVNVSARQVRDGCLTDDVARALYEAGLPGDALWVEVTESSAMLHADETIETLSELRRLGVRVCIDDFGTGFSSLAYLQEFPVDRLKIDQTFVRRLSGTGPRHSFIDAILAIAGNLELDVVAEGVETTEQRDLLRHAGCRGAQGYLFGRPASLDSLVGAVSPAPSRRPAARPASSPPPSPSPSPGSTAGSRRSI